MDSQEPENTILIKKKRTPEETKERNRERSKQKGRLLGKLNEMRNMYLKLHKIDILEYFEQMKPIPAINEISKK
jgi:hypothetical protein